MEKELVVEENNTFSVPGSRVKKTAVVGAAIVAMVVVAANGIGSSERVQGDPGASIMKQATQPDSCFEENVAYQLGKVKKGKSPWILADDKRDSPQECQIWCQTNPACQFFTFKQRTKRCILTTERGEKLKKGQKAISGPRICPGVAKPCVEYVASGAWTLKGPGGVQNCESKEWTGQLSGQSVKVAIWGSCAAAFDSPELVPEYFKQCPTWPKGMPLNYPVVTETASRGVGTNFNITVDGNPIENVVIGLYMFLPVHPQPDGPAEWKGTLSEGTWIPETDPQGSYRADLLDGGRTLNLGPAANIEALGFWRLSKPVSKISITTAGTKGIPGIPQMMLMVYQGKQCR